VEGSAPSKTEEEPTCNFSVRRARSMGAPATPDSLILSVGMEKKGEERLIFVHLDRLEPWMR
jgi:hypothetical protein